MGLLKLNKNQQYKLKQVAALTIVWVLVGNVIYLDLYAHMYLFDIESRFDLNLTEMLLGNSIAPFLAGIIGGGTMVFGLKTRFATYSYARNILHILIVFTLTYFLVTWVAGLFYFSVGMGKSLFDVDIAESFTFIFSLEGIRNYFRWLLIVSISNLFLQIDDKFGPGVLWAIIIGKYQRPVDEKRIVMFLDLKNSTGIAEQLGGKGYHSFLKEFFNDITEPILKSNGLIYQYVGDEVVVVWKVKDGATNANCVRCYFDIEEAIEMRKDFYMHDFGIVPEFKAGIHTGEVTIGEIGTIKRDITLSGDVLNTTSRIQEKCKESDEKLIISKALLNLIPKSPMDVLDLGLMDLKGKSKSMELAAIRGLV